MAFPVTGCGTPCHRIANVDTPMVPLSVSPFSVRAPVHSRHQVCTVPSLLPLSTVGCRAEGLFFEPPPWGVVFGPRWPPAQARAQSTPGPVWLQELQEEHAACQLTWMDAVGVQESRPTLSKCIEYSSPRMDASVGHTKMHGKKGSRYT